MTVPKLFVDEDGDALRVWRSGPNVILEMVPSRASANEGETGGSVALAPEQLRELITYLEEIA